METLNLFLQIFILVIQACILLIPFLGTKALFDMRHSDKLEMPTKRGYLLLVLIALAIVCSAIQIFISNTLNEIKDKEFKKEIAIRDSTNQFQTQEMLAKYGYKVDSTNMVIVKAINDSSLKNTYNIYHNNEQQPQLTFDNIIFEKREQDVLSFRLDLASAEATSCNIKVKMEIIAYNNTTEKFDFYLKNEPLITQGDKIIKDEGVSHLYEFKDLNFKDHHSYYFRLLGSYENSNKKRFNVDKIFSYDFRQVSQYGFPNTIFEKKMREFIKNK